MVYQHPQSCSEAAVTGSLSVKVREEKCARCTHAWREEFILVTNLEGERDSGVTVGKRRKSVTSDEWGNCSPQEGEESVLSEQS